jgi:D-alanine-D-alanine ligase
VLRIGIAYSLKPDDHGEPADGPDDRYEEFDKPETIEALAEAIRGDGHDVSLLGDGREFLAKMFDAPPDFVFNFAEGQGVGRDREARVPCVCEMLGVPYSGSDPLTMAVALDKGVAKRMVASHHAHAEVGVPGLVTIPPETSRELAREEYIRLNFSRYNRYPVLLKPALEGSSKGIRQDCIADDEDQAVALFARLARDYRQPIVVEDFIEGDEVTVGVIGNGVRAKVLGVMRVVPNVPTPRFVYSLEVKRDYRNRVRYESPARMSAAVVAPLERAALACYRALGCRDVARIDFRVDEDGHPFFIEANPLPGLAPVTSDLVILAEGYGISHGDLVRMILRAALARVGLGTP